jgi:hypothetical protein
MKRSILVTADLQQRLISPPHRRHFNEEKLSKLACAAIRAALDAADARRLLDLRDGKSKSTATR